MIEKEEFERIIEEMLNRLDLTREERIAEVEKFIDDYAAIHGTYPKGVSIEEITDYILDEELKDTNRMKMRNTEYPFMSERQLRRRYAEEILIGYIDNITWNNKPTRRKRSEYENAFMDKTVKSRDKERRKTYNDFKYGRSPGVFTVNIETGEKIIHDPEKYEKFYGNMV